MKVTYYIWSKQGEFRTQQRVKLTAMPFKKNLPHPLLIFTA
jgi:hypothetical protein